MAFPVILVDSATGSDSAASGAGPSTALTGSANASTSGTGLVVTLPAGTVLTGVSTTGSDVIYLADATAGARNFGKITATSGSGGATPTVTVSDAFGVSLTGKSWAIGGKRATAAGAASYKLFDNNSAAGDLMPGWAVEMQSAHAETVAAPLIFRRDGDTTSGPITLRGASGAATLPLLTFSNSARAVDLTTAVLKNVVARDFELRNSNATKTGSTAVDVGSNNYDNRAVVVGVKAAHVSNYFNKGMIPSICSVTLRCEFGYCNTVGIDGNANAFQDALAAVIAWNICHHCTSHGIYISAGAGAQGTAVLSNLCHHNGGDGIRLTSALGNAVNGNTCDNNTGSGLYLTLSGTATVLNNILSNNGAYGVNLNGATAASLGMLTLDRNDAYGNISGAYSTSGVATNDPAANPTFTSSSDWTPTNAAVQVGYSLPGYP